MLLMCALALAEDPPRPADEIPDPVPERCVAFLGDIAGEQGAIAPEGLGYEQVRGALNGVIQHALKCGRPAGMDEVHLTFELMVGCDGVVASIETTSAGGAPAPYVQCVADVIRKADFPAHDMADGMPVTYPVDVSFEPR
jgi:hypothetical protein